MSSPGAGQFWPPGEEPVFHLARMPPPLSLPTPHRRQPITTLHQLTQPETNPIPPPTIPPTYTQLAPNEAVECRVSAVEDHVLWLLSRRRFERALAVCEAAAAGLTATVASQFLDDLMQQQQYDRAAHACTRLLKGDPQGWEMAAQRFAAAGQLAALAPYLPTAGPPLREQLYTAALAALIAAPQQHARLLVRPRGRGVCLSRWWRRVAWGIH